MAKKAKISPEEVKRIAALGRLRLTGDEVKEATGDLSRILDHFSKIQQIGTEGVPTADDVSGLMNVQREDEAHPECLCDTKAVLDRAPRLKDNQVKVDAIFGNP